MAPDAERTFSNDTQKDFSKSAAGPRRGRGSSRGRRPRGRRSGTSPRASERVSDSENQPENTPPGQIQDKQFREPPIQEPVQTFETPPPVIEITTLQEEHEQSAPGPEEPSIREEGRLREDETASSRRDPSSETAPEQISEAPPVIRKAPAPLPTSHHRPQQREPRRDFRPASSASIQQAIDEVNEVIESLRNALDDMEELMESLEMFERQKEVDEQEIETLRRSLRQLHRPRESSQRH